MGLSLLGNLDGIYKHANFPSIRMHTLTTGSRQRNGAMLLFGYTFAGKLWISLGYDENGFADDVVDRFWAAEPVRDPGRSQVLLLILHFHLWLCLHRGKGGKSWNRLLGLLELGQRTPAESRRWRGWWGLGGALRWLH